MARSVTETVGCVVLPLAATRLIAAGAGDRFDVRARRADVVAEGQVWYVTGERVAIAAWASAFKGEVWG